MKSTDTRTIMKPCRSAATMVLLALLSVRAVAQQPAPPTQTPPVLPPEPAAPAAIQHAPLGDEAGAIRVDTLVAAALGANPELAAMRREFDAARARVPQAKALPDPMVMFGNVTQGNPVPFAGLTGDFSEIYVGASQTVPWFGVRRLRGLVASSEAEAKFQEYLVKARQVVTDVKSTAFEIASLDRAIAVIARDADILGKLAEVAEARYAVGKAEQIDTINARLEITELLHMRGTLEAKRETAAARLDALLFRDPDAAVGPIALERGALDVPPYDELVRQAEANAPALAEQRRLLEARNHALRLAEREAKYPEVSFTFQYHNRPTFPDFYEYGVTLELPLWASTKQRYGIEEKTADLAAARGRLASTGALVRSRLREAYVRATTAAKLVRLHEQGLVPQATLALESALTAYQVGKVDFQTVLTALKKALDYETEYYQLLADYRTALAEMDALAGTDLTR